MERLNPHLQIPKGCGTSKNKEVSSGGADGSATRLASGDVMNS